MLIGNKLRADARARHGAVVHVLDLLRGERVEKVAIVVQSRAGEERP